MYEHVMFFLLLDLFDASQAKPVVDQNMKLAKTDLVVAMLLTWVIETCS
jgi:hypothetical protein